MADLDAQLSRRQRGGHDRVRIALHQNDVRPLVFEHLLRAGKDLAGLHTMRPRTDLEIEIRSAEFEVLEEYSIHRIGVMLAGMQDEVVQLPPMAFSYYRSHLDDFRPGTKDDGDLHWKTRCMSILCNLCTRI